MQIVSAVFSISSNTKTVALLVLCPSGPTSRKECRGTTCRQNYFTAFGFLEFRISYPYWYENSSAAGYASSKVFSGNFKELSIQFDRSFENTPLA